MTSALIVAAGRGTRMGPGVDKLFLEVGGLPVIAHTWRCFESAPCIEEIILVVREGLQTAFAELARQQAFRKPFRCVPGGAERQDSVWNGLQALATEADFVAIHDGARPCVTADLIAATLQAARETGAAVAAQPVVDTIKVSDDGTLISRNLDRSRLWAVQTPQTFRVEVIRRALTAVKAKGLVLTDDTAACEFIGQPVRLVPGPAPNPKVTAPTDVAYVETLLGQRK